MNSPTIEVVAAWHLMSALQPVGTGENESILGPCMAYSVSSSHEAQFYTFSTLGTLCNTHLHRPTHTHTYAYTSSKRNILAHCRQGCTGMFRTSSIVCTTLLVTEILNWVLFERVCAYILIALAYSNKQPGEVYIFYNLHTHCIVYTKFSMKNK